MSNSSKSSSSESDVDSDFSSNSRVNATSKFCFFLTETGHSLNFVLLADNMTSSDVANATAKIQSHMGTVSTRKQDVGSHCAVLVTDKATSWNYSGDVFKLSYINDCIDDGQVLNIALYLKDPPSKLYVENFDYMNVIYHRKYSWETIPLIYKLRKTTEHHPKSTRVDPEDSDSSVDLSCPVASYNSINHPTSNKQTKQLYTLPEKETMIRYVVERKMYNRVKGTSMYKEMEAANICPVRTWQSLRNYFLKHLPKEIPQYSFLTADQKRQLLDGLYPYK